ncbi:MAG: hypothetical protein L3K26_15535 [Candidatus Hydrogenedentes bacterium]|nr:hypothetical protein [Candidatus Hydrogenedentota bacterium]
MIWCLLLFVLGVSLIVIEFFLPGGICAVLGIVLLVVSTGLGIAAYPEHTFFIIMGEILGAFAGIVLGLYLLANTKVGQGLFLNTTLAPADKNSGQAAIAVGATGVVLTDLRPAGSIEVDGKRFDAVSDGDLIEEGGRIHVLEVHGNRIVVEATPDE